MIPFFQTKEQLLDSRKNAVRKVLLGHVPRDTHLVVAHTWIQKWMIDVTAWYFCFGNKARIDTKDNSDTCSCRYSLFFTHFILDLLLLCDDSAWNIFTVSHYRKARVVSRGSLYFIPWYSAAFQSVFVSSSLSKAVSIFLSWKHHNSTPYSIKTIRICDSIDENRFFYPRTVK